MDITRAAYDEVYAYTVGRPGFVLQHVVDAFAVQTANADSRPIGVVFGLAPMNRVLRRGMQTNERGQ